MLGRTMLTAAGAALCVAALLAGGAWFATRAGEGPGGVEHALIGQTLLTYPVAAARTRASPGAGRLDRLELAANFPDFEPAAQVRGATTAEVLAERAARTVFVTVTPGDRSSEPAERPARLYAPLLEPIGFTQPAGLVLRRFQHGSPYEGEELYMTPPEGRGFWARCPTSRRAQEPCLTELSLDGLTLTLRFAPALLPEWERLRDGVRAWVAQMRR